MNNMSKKMETFKVEYYESPLFSRTKNYWNSTQMVSMPEKATNTEIILEGLKQVGAYPKSYDAQVYVSRKVETPFGTDTSWEKRREVSIILPEVYWITAEDINNLEEIHNHCVLSDDPSLIDEVARVLNHVLSNIYKQKEKINDNKQM